MLLSGMSKIKIILRFITLFSSILPMVLFLRVMDVFWFEKIKVIFRTALAVVKIRREDLLAVKLLTK